MNNFLPPNHTVTIRQASCEDFPAIAWLLRQLYTIELPGALHGSPAAQQELLQFTLAAKNDQGLRGRYVACDAAGQVVATATLAVGGGAQHGAGTSSS